MAVLRIVGNGIAGTDVVDLEMKLRRTIAYAVCLALSTLFATAAVADRRVALIIGNAAYKSAPTLSNTISDATAISNLLKSIGFEVVISRNDLGVVEFKRAVRDFLIGDEGRAILRDYGFSLPEDGAAAADGSGTTGEG